VLKIAATVADEVVMAHDVCIESRGTVRPWMATSRTEPACTKSPGLS